MGIFDRFKKKFEAVGKDKKPRNVVAEEPKKSAKSEKTDRAVVVTGDAKKKAAKKENKKEGKKRVVKDDTRDAYRILRHVLITEKASMMAARRQYTFAVDPGANKAQVAEAVANVYGVQPISVHMITVSGKQVRFGRIEGATKDWKKAIVTLKEGEKIDLYEGV